ncbi:hypothetical protein J6590_061626 [Homalodisca vitripennis]|nr:hypothetical protein J6590_061626 [Homalodisca vitripennis]
MNIADFPCLYILELASTADSSVTWSKAGTFTSTGLEAGTTSAYSNTERQHLSMSTEISRLAELNGTQLGIIIQKHAKDTSLARQVIASVQNTRQQFQLLHKLKASSLPQDVAQVVGEGIKKSDLKEVFVKTLPKFEEPILAYVRPNTYLRLAVDTVYAINYLLNEFELSKIPKKSTIRVIAQASIRNHFPLSKVYWLLSGLTPDEIKNDSLVRQLDRSSFKLDLDSMQARAVFETHYQGRQLRGGDYIDSISLLGRLSPSLLQKFPVQEHRYEILQVIPKPRSLPTAYQKLWDWSYVARIGQKLWDRSYVARIDQKLWDWSYVARIGQKLWDRSYVARIDQKLWDWSYVARIARNYGIGPMLRGLAEIMGSVLCFEDCHRSTFRSHLLMLQLMEYVKADCRKTGKLPLHEEEMWGVRIHYMGQWVYTLPLEILREYLHTPLDTAWLRTVQSPALSPIQAYYLTGKGEVLNAGAANTLMDLDTMLHALPASELVSRYSGNISSNVLQHLTANLPGGNIPRTIALVNKISHILDEPFILENLLNSSNLNNIMSLVPPNDFKKAGMRFIHWSITNPESVEKIQQMPQPILAALLEMVREDKKDVGWSWHYLLERKEVRQLIGGMTCEHIEEMDTGLFIPIISLYNRQRQQSFPKNLQQCCLRKLMEHLQLKMTLTQTHSDFGLISMLEPVEIESLGGFVLVGLPVEALKASQHLDHILATIGKLSNTDLLMAANISHLQAVAHLAIKQDGIVDVFTAGNLVWFLPPKSKVPELKLMLEAKLLDTTICVPTASRRNFAAILLSQFGPAVNWSGGVLATLQDMLVVFTQEELSNVSKSAWTEAADCLKTHYADDVNLVSSTPFYQFCSGILGKSEEVEMMSAVKMLTKWLLTAAQWQLDTVLHVGAPKTSEYWFSGNLDWLNHHEATPVGVFSPDPETTSMSSEEPSSTTVETSTVTEPTTSSTETLTAHQTTHTVVSTSSSSTSKSTRASEKTTTPPYITEGNTTDKGTPHENSHSVVDSPVVNNVTIPTTVEYQSTPVKLNVTDGSPTNSTSKNGEYFDKQDKNSTLKPEGGVEINNEEHLNINSSSEAAVKPHENDLEGHNKTTNTSSYESTTVKTNNTQVDLVKPQDTNSTEFSPHGKNGLPINGSLHTRQIGMGELETNIPPTLPMPQQSSDNGKSDHENTIQYDDQSVTTVKSHTILHDPSKKLTDVEENTVVYESSNKNKNTIIEGIEKVTEEETSADSNLRQKRNSAISTKVTCNAVKMVGKQAGLVITEGDLEEMSDSDIDDCKVEFGAMDLSFELRKSIWKRINFSYLHGIHLLGNLLQASAVADFWDVDYNVNSPWALEIIHAITSHFNYTMNPVVVSLSIISNLIYLRYEDSSINKRWRAVLLRAGVGLWRGGVVKGRTRVATLTQYRPCCHQDATTSLATRAFRRSLYRWEVSLHSTLLILRRSLNIQGASAKALDFEDTNLRKGGAKVLLGLSAGTNRPFQVHLLNHLLRIRRTCIN